MKKVIMVMAAVLALGLAGCPPGQEEPAEQEQPAVTSPAPEGEMMEEEGGMKTSPAPEGGMMEEEGGMTTSPAPEAGEPPAEVPGGEMETTTAPAPAK